MNIIRKVLGVFTREDHPEPLVTAENPGIQGSPLLKLFAGIDTLIGLERVPILTYEEAVRAFIDKKPADDGMVRGALLCTDAGFNESLVSWVFLDRDNNPIPDEDGKLFRKRLVTSSLDDELAECFSGSDILIVE